LPEPGKTLLKGDAQKKNFPGKGRFSGKSGIVGKPLNIRTGFGKKKRILGMEKFSYQKKDS